jgi:hypothetical protein
VNTNLAIPAAAQRIGEETRGKNSVGACGSSANPRSPLRGGDWASGETWANTGGGNKRILLK